MELSADISDICVDTEYITILRVFKLSSLRLNSVLLRSKFLDNGILI
jgi:hypothetical protein